MALFFRRKANKKKGIRRLLIILLLILAFVNFDSICRFFYPFPYREITFHYSRTYNIDPYLLAAMMKAESNFNPRAVSPRGARGLMQIMPETGQWIAQQMGNPDFEPDRLFHPETSINFGAWYIADLGNEFHGDVILALAAYNGGRGNVKEWLSTDSLGGGENMIDQIPFPETRHYIRKVLLYHRIYDRLYSADTGHAFGYDNNKIIKTSENPVYN